MFGSLEDPVFCFEVAAKGGRRSFEDEGLSFVVLNYRGFCLKDFGSACLPRHEVRETARMHVSVFLAVLIETEAEGKGEFREVGSAVRQKSRHLIYSENVSG